MTWLRHLRLSGTAAIQLFLSAAIFFADLWLPNGRSLVVLYVLVVLLAGRKPGARRVVMTALACVALTGIGYLIRHGLHWHLDYLVRRLVCGLSIGIAAIMTIRNQMLEQQRRGRAALLDLTGDAMFVRSARDVITSWSQGAETLYGWSAQEAVGRTAAELIFPHHWAEAASKQVALLRDGRWEGEMRHSLRDGREITVMSRWALQTDRQGHALAILETNRDITESKRVEAEMRQSEERYRRIFHMTGAAIWEEDYAAVLPLIARLRKAGVTDFETYFREHPDVALEALSNVRVVDVNQSAVTLFQAVNKAELMASLEKIFIPETLDSFCLLLGALADGRSSCEASTAVQTMRGERRSILMSVIFPPEEEPVANVLVSVMDNTERSLAEERLRLAQEELGQATRVATLGELTASIAHDVDEPIAAIIAHAHRGLAYIRQPRPDILAATDVIGQIVEEGTRAAEVVIRIRNFLRKAVPQHAPFDLRKTIEAAALLVRRELTSQQVLLRLDLAEDLPEIVGNRTRIEHVIVRLLINGIQSTTGTAGAPHSLIVRADRRDREVIIEVWDSGRGKDAASQGRLFAPVFPKPDDRDGRDIGLAVCRATIEAHGGRIWASTRGDRGASVYFTLPVYTDGGR